MKKPRGSWENILLGAEIWPCLVWTWQIGLRIWTLGLQCPDKDLKAITFERPLLLGSYGSGFCSRRIIQPPLKCPPRSARSKAPAARWKTFERRKLSFAAAKIPTKPVLGPTTDRFVKQPRQQRTNRVDEHYGHKSQWQQQVVLYSIQRHCSL